MCLPVPFSKSITTTAPRIAWLTRRLLSSRSSGPMKHRFQGHPLLHGRHRHGNLPIYTLYCLKCPKKTDNSKWSHKHIDMIPDVRSASHGTVVCFYRVLQSYGNVHLDGRLIYPFGVSAYKHMSSHLSTPAGIVAGAESPSSLGLMGV